MTADRSLETYLFRPATGDPLREETKEDEEERVRRDFIRRGQPVFDMVARLVASSDRDALELLYSGSTPLHKIIADAVDFRKDDGFAARTGAPFSAREHAGVHAVRALGGLGLALIAPESAEQALYSALAWYAEARSSAAARGWNPRDLARAGSKLPLAQQLARIAGDERPARGSSDKRDEWWAGGVLTAAVTLCALNRRAGTSGRKSGITVLLAGRTGHGEEGLRGLLQASVMAGLPAGLVAAPERMALFAADPDFWDSLDCAGEAAGAARIDGTVLWSIEGGLEGPVPQIAGASAGAAFAVVCGEVRRLSVHLAEMRVIRRVNEDNAVIGQVDEHGLLQGVDGYGSKLNALGRRSRVIVPSVDFGKASEAKPERELKIVPVARWQEAARTAQRPSREVMLRQGLVIVITVIVLLSGFLGRQVVDTAAQQRLAAVQQGLAAAQRGASLSARLTSEADNLRTTAPGLAAQFDAAAYQAHPTPVAGTDLLNDESSPLDTYLPAGTSASAGAVGGLAVSPDGNAVAVVSDSGVRLYDAADPARPSAAVGGQVPGNAVGGSLAFSPDGDVLAAGTSLWNVTDLAAPSKLGTLSAVGITALAFAREAPILAVGTANGDIQLWNLSDPARPVPLGGLSGPAARNSDDTLGLGSITSLMFAGSAADTLWAATGEGAIETWDTGDPVRPKLAATFPADNGIDVDTSFSPAGEAVQTDANGYSDTDDLQINESAGATTAYLVPSPVSSGNASPSVISPDGQTIATRTADGDITLFNGAVDFPLGPSFPQNENYSAGIPARPLENGPGPMAFNAAGTILAVDDDGQGIYLWHLPAGYTVQPNLVGNISALPGSTISGGLLASVNGEEVDAQSLAGQQAAVFSVPAVPSGPSADLGTVAIADDGRLLASSDSSEIYLVRPDFPDGTDQPLGSLPATAQALALSENGTVLAAVGTDGATTLWDVASPSRPRELGEPFGTAGVAAVLSPDGTVLALISGQMGVSKSLQLWSLADPARPERLGAPIAEPAGQTVSAMAISPDNQTLALGRQSGEVDLIPLSPTPGTRYGVPLASNYDDQVNSGYMKPGRTGVYGLVYSPDGTTLTAVNDDKTVRAWNLKPTATIAAVCAATGQSLTAATWNEYISGAAFSPPCPADAAATGTAQPPATSDPAAAAAICTAGDLTLALALGPVESTALTTLTTLVITNVSRAACSVPGTPAVNLIGPRYGDGSTTFSLVSDPEILEDPEKPSQTVTLPPGGKAHIDASLFFTSGTPQSADLPPSYIRNWVPQQVQIVLPGSHAALSVPWGSDIPVLPMYPPKNSGNFYTPLMSGAA